MNRYLQLELFPQIRIDYPAIHDELVLIANDINKSSLNCEGIFLSEKKYACFIHWQQQDM